MRLTGLGRDYGDRPALKGIDLVMERGETALVTGPNGSGKTTLLRILAGLLRPSQGAVEVLGCELPRESWRLRGRIGYVGHEPLLYRDLTARENLALVARLHGLDRDEGADRVASLLAAVGMERRADDRIPDLSAGMVRRVAVCRAVLGEPELLLLDEPEVHLDAEARQLVEPLIGPADGRTRVVVSHDPDPRRFAADRLLRLAADGTVEAAGRP